MKALSLSCMLCVALQLAASAVATTITPTDQVSVRYSDPGQFTEAKRAASVPGIDAKAYLKPLKAYFTRRAARILAPGQRLDIVVTDVDLAGEYEPWRGPGFSTARIVKNGYPPRIDLNFTLYGEGGEVLSTGSRKLRDPGFLDHGGRPDMDSLPYEKSLIDQWLRRGTGKL